MHIFDYSFLDDGLLPVKGAWDRMTELSELINGLPKERYSHVIITLDWHPDNHSSFTESGGMWPKHCVAYTHGSLPVDIIRNAVKPWEYEGKLTYVTKGKDKEVEEYCGFLPNLITDEIREIFESSSSVEIAGCVGTVCVQNSIMGIIENGLAKPEKITALLGGIAQLQPEDEDKFKEFCINQKVNFI